MYALHHLGAVKVARPAKSLKGFFHLGGGLTSYVYVMAKFQLISGKFIIGGNP